MDQVDDKSYRCRLTLPIDILISVTEAGNYDVKCFTLKNDQCDELASALTGYPMSISGDGFRFLFYSVGGILEFVQRLNKLFIEIPKHLNIWEHGQRLKKEMEEQQCTSEKE
jgi:hypothetical protein